MDMTQINVTLAKWEEEGKQETAAARIVLLAELKMAGITQVDAFYDGCGDSGNVDWTNFKPEGIKLGGNLGPRLRDFLWSVAYNLHPGFENNDGGCGETTWAIETDVIDVEHQERYTEYNNYSHEDV